MEYRKPADYLELELLHTATGKKTQTKRFPLPRHGIVQYLNLDSSHQIIITWPMLDADDET